LSFNLPNVGRLETLDDKEADFVLARGFLGFAVAFLLGLDFR
tara:strand:- start:70 stop:195 length:126 start_codon:yes stop_codon:yes gene_type:complete